jgi:hypothetical protein
LLAQTFCAKRSFNCGARNDRLRYAGSWSAVEKREMGMTSATRNRHQKAEGVKQCSWIELLHHSSRRRGCSSACSMESADFGQSNSGDFAVVVVLPSRLCPASTVAAHGCADSMHALGQQMAHCSPSPPSALDLTSSKPKNSPNSGDLGLPTPR